MRLIKPLISLCFLIVLINSAGGSECVSPLVPSDAGASTSSVDPTNPNSPFNTLLNKIKDTVLDKSPESYSALALQLTEFRKISAESLWVIEDDQEGKYRNFISFAHALNRTTIYIHVMQRTANLAPANQKFQESINLLESLGKISAQEKARAAQIILQRIENYEEEYKRTIDFFEEIKSQETRFFSPQLMNDALAYPYFTVFDWNFLGAKINRIPALLGKWLFQLGQIKEELLERFPQDHNQGLTQAINPPS
ncbi:MAG: hypothetical protein J6Y94_02470 [Bacteriovoracaceae bacterium]|nr:hypothetical protein [Bacteriovoracaceae bacterium]